MPETMRIEEDGRAAEALEAALLHSLRGTLPQAENTAVTFVCRDGAGELTGGVSGGTAYGWLLVKLLWVADAHRRCGLGSRLIEAVEERGRGIGCHSAWLDTSNPEAERFYSGHGYRPFGVLSNTAEQFPPTHRRVFMKKALTP